MKTQKWMWMGILFTTLLQYAYADVIPPGELPPRVPQDGTVVESVSVPLPDIEIPIQPIPIEPSPLPEMELPLEQLPVVEPTGEMILEPEKYVPFETNGGPFGGFTIRMFSITTVTYLENSVQPSMDSLNPRELAIEKITEGIENQINLQPELPLEAGSKISLPATSGTTSGTDGVAGSMDSVIDSALGIS